MKYQFLLVTILISELSYINSLRGGRGGSGGFRGGSFRGSSSRSRYSGSRSRYRSVSYESIRMSHRYSSWSSRYGFSSDFRYKDASYTNKRSGIVNGLIIMSPHQRSSFIIYHDKSYDDISICYNEFSMSRNSSVSPWFVCPWGNPSYRYCCGDEIEEECCGYFDRPQYMTRLVIGINVPIFILILICCWKSKKQKKENVSKEIPTDTDNALNQDSNNLNYSNNRPFTGSDKIYQNCNPSENTCMAYPSQPIHNEDYLLYNIPEVPQVMDPSYLHANTTMSMPHTEFSPQLDNQISYGRVDSQNFKSQFTYNDWPPTYSEVMQKRNH